MAAVIDNLVVDNEARKQIVSDTTQNFFVEAGAGSGKTTMLVRRMVAMVEQGIDIDKICAITFTKAAAGEFYERFQKLLAERSNPGYINKNEGKPGQLPAPTEESRKRCAKALQNIDLCFMGTIDAFCNMIISEHPSEARVPSDSQVISDEDRSIYYKQMFVKISNGYYDKDCGSELSHLAKNFSSCHHHPEEVFAKGLTFLMDHRNTDIHYQRRTEMSISADFENERRSLINCLKVLNQHHELEYAESNSLKAWTYVSDSLNTLSRSWDDLSSVVYALKNIVQIRLSIDAIDSFSFPLSDLFIEHRSRGKQWCEFSEVFNEDIYGKLKEIQYEITMTFLMDCKGLIEKEMQTSGKLSYFDYLYYLRNMLKEDASGDGRLIRYISGRHQYYLVDEFQDTNPLQAEIIFYLAAQKPQAEWQKCLPRPGSLFIVGDPKQSIYRFRGADVTSFMRIRSLFTGEAGCVLKLTRNFRSTGFLTAYFNRVFSKLLPEETEDQSAFEEIPLPEKEDIGFGGVYKYKCFTDSAASTEEERDCVLIGNIIDRLVDREEFQIPDPETGDLRKIDYRDIMVIPGSKKNLTPIMEELERRRIPIHVEGKVNFDECPSLRNASLIYSCIADRNAQMDFYALLQSDIYSFSNEDLLNYVSEGGKITLGSSVAEQEKERMSEQSLAILEAVSSLQEFAKKAAGRAYQTPAALFEAIISEFSVLRYSPSDELEILCYALELLRAEETAGTLAGLIDGAAFLKKLLQGESGLERCLKLKTDQNCVHMANLHKVKGLEAPIVILSRTSARGKSAEYRIENREDSSEGSIFCMTEGEEPKKYTLFETNRFADEAELEKASLKAETDRLKYVAATRARNALIISDSYFLKGTTEVNDCRWKALIEGATPYFFDALPDLPMRSPIPSEAVLADDLYCGLQEDNACTDHRERENSGYLIQTPSHVKVPSKLTDEESPVVIEEETTPIQAKPASGLHRYPALLGTMTHRLMEILVSTEDSHDPKKAVPEILSEYLPSEMEALSDEFSKALLQVSEIIHSGGYVQENAAPQDILTELLNAEETFCEVPFCYSEDTENGKVIWNGIMDVIYKMNGEWHIIDYKTNADGNNLDDRYKGQLEAYKRAFKEINGIDVKDAYTYHIDI